MNPRPFTDLIDVFQRSTAEFARSNLFGTKTESGWKWITYGEFGKRVDNFRGGLAHLGIEAGDTVAVISANRVEWAIGAYAAYGLGARYCPMYESQLEKDWRHIVQDSGARVLFASTYAIYEQVKDWAGEVGALENVYCMSLPAEDEASFESLERLGAEHPTPCATVESKTVCGFIYTSGTTGKPKGVLLSHGNITSNINCVANNFPMDRADISLSFLPWAHSFGQTCELHTLFSRGAAMALNDSVDNLIANLAVVRPTILFAVPRIFNRIYDGLQKKMADAGGLTKTLFDAALANAERREELAKKGRSSLVVNLKHAVLDRLVFSKVRDRFGGRLRYAFSGGAALSPEVGAFIDKLGIEVYEGYGLTETSPIATANHPGARKMGSVGRPLEGVEVIIDTSVVDDEGSEDGEVIVKGPNVMMGYHNLPDETAAVMTEDGAFRTGDLGRLDEDGFLFITGRIKEQYKLENGKYVAPAPLEELLQLSPFIVQAFLDGFNKPYNVALLVPDRAALEKWAKQQGLPTDDYDALLAHEKVQKLIGEQLETYSKSFKSYERPRKFHLIAEEFSVENGMLTPKMSVKRKVVQDRYGAELDALHAEG
jgi:long-chain acyl-CoA synthetase